MVDERRIVDANRCLGPFILIVFFIISTLMFSLVGTVAGRIYSTLIIISVLIVMILYLFFIKENESRDFELPFEKTFLQFCVWLWVGLLLPLIFNSTFGRIFNLKLHDIVKPFVMFSNVAIEKSFNVIQTEYNPFVNTYNTVFGAGVGETFIFNIMAVILGIVVGMLMLAILSESGVNISEGGKKIFKFIVGVLIIPTIFFVIAHKFNQDYVNMPTLFLFAAIFLLLTNLGLYYFNVFFGFVAGIHMSNNLNAYGLKLGMTNLFTPQTGALGFLQITVIAFFLITLIFVIFKIFTKFEDVKDVVVEVDSGI